jgi:hypothetical protein
MQSVRSIDDVQLSSSYREVSALWKSRTVRQKCKLTVLEGNETIAAAANAGLQFKSIYYTEQQCLDQLPSSLLSAAGVTCHYIQGEHAKFILQTGLTSSVFGKE